jgi:conjugal transfer pilus assembly protein TraA
MNKFLVAIFAVVVLPGLALAGTGGAEFNAAYTTLSDWATGDLGRLITAGLLITGLAMGIVRQSIMAAVPAIGAGLVFNVGPAVIDAVVAATI